MPGTEGTWPTLSEIAKKSRDAQRQVLRSHEESGFDTNQAEEAVAIQLRDDLDRELGRIAELEFLAQVDELESNQLADIPHFPALICNAAFVHYLNSYLYFGVRFAAGRFFPPGGPGVISASDCNEPFAGLPSPPICQKGWDNSGVAKAFVDLVANDRQEPVWSALRFLDGFSEKRENPEPTPHQLDDSRSFELWLRRLYFDPRREPYFARLAEGLRNWATSRYDFYSDLETKGSAEGNARAKWVRAWKQDELRWAGGRKKPWVEGQWTAKNPIVARCALVDFYWLAKILRADVSAQGNATYQDHSWLYLLAQRESFFTQVSEEIRASRKIEILRMEEVLRTAFGYVCDLIQNAIEIAEEREDRESNPQDYPSSSDGTNRKWRAVEDDEQGEIRKQRIERQHRSSPSGIDLSKLYCKGSASKQGWSLRVLAGEYVDNLVGVALSGGGIRSATFNLGVLQQLQALDLLRHVDYLSTVSGGGYIGAWLVANVRRTSYWLSRMTSWDASVEHLRQYSNYLAPHNGIVSPDSWSMWLTWIRNAFLVQLTAIMWLVVILIAVLDSKRYFDWAAPLNPAELIAPQRLLAGIMVVIAAILVFFLISRGSSKKDSLHAGIFRIGNKLAIAAAVLAWIGCYLAAGLLWSQAKRLDSTGESYASIFVGAVRDWPIVLKIVYPLGLVLLAAVTVRRRIDWRTLPAFVATVTLVPLISYLILCAQLRIYVLMLASSGDLAEWLAFSFGPAMTMLAVTVAIVIFIGLLGRGAPDWTREWWTRYGAWIGLVGTGALILTSAAVFAPHAVLVLPGDQSLWNALKASGMAAWIASTVAGIFAGKSTKTGQGAGTSKTLEFVARFGALVFIAGAVALISTALYLLVINLIPNSDTEYYWCNLQAIVVARWIFDRPLLWVVAGGVFGLGLLFSNRFDLNTFSLNQFYRDRLVRCYLGATRWQPGKRRPHPFTGFDGDDDLRLADLRHEADGFCEEPFRGPFPIVNCTLNLGGSSDLAVHTRHGAAFAATPLYCGASRKKIGYVPTTKGLRESFAGGLSLGQAISVSGAAASPNMGYNTSPLVSFLMTMFNVRLGWWFPNPAQSSWSRSSPPSGRYLVSELFGLADERGRFINISDGGHFENLGVYELIRRRTQVIIASDAECDSGLTFGALGNLIRICETDFGARIDLDVSSIRKREAVAFSHSHCAVGRITYSNGTRGLLIYLKASLTGDEDIGIAQYRSGHFTFPHESTSNQFYREDQFEAYRRLGQHITQRAFRDAEDEDGDPVAIAAKLFDVWAAAGSATKAFVNHARTLDRIWDRFRVDSKLNNLLMELTGSGPQATPLTPKEFVACSEISQLMENVFLDLRLDDFWDSPDNRGWIILFRGFARSPKFQEVWKRSRSTYGIRFEYFCSQRLGLERDNPVVRV